MKIRSRVKIRSRGIIRSRVKIRRSIDVAKLYLSDDRGSLSILIITLFLLLLVFSFATVNVSDAFLAKRQLINIGEVAITDAAHTLSLTRYYSGDRTADDALGDGSVFRVPIDCNSAAINFESAMNSMRLRGQSVALNAWNCVNDEVTATISAQIAPAVVLPLGMNSSTEMISASISATSIIGGSR